MIVDIKTLASELAVAYSSLRAAVCAMHIAEARTVEARGALATARADVLINHADDIKTLGANEAVREANISKRPENIPAALGAIKHPEFPHTDFWTLQQQQPRPNWWFGTSVENRAAADKRIPELLKVPHA